MSERGTPGPKGDKGDRGERGLQGLKGATGPAGAGSKPITTRNSTSKTSLLGTIVGIDWDVRHKTVIYTTEDGQTMSINYN